MSRSRSSRETFQDLELRLGPAYLSKGGMLAANCLRGCPDFIMIEDDDDDVQICAAASSGETFRVFPYSSPWAPAIREEDLELRLGVGDTKAHMIHMLENTLNGDISKRLTKPLVGILGIQMVGLIH
ncbi:uncharacterized protein LOC103712381 isoform X3 [Phoenix dactylifera]|uniref:Uncharacterized protein LOC103712381 isoform X3 n=1 Tax=Phoenix dactylifera TaxID=42345 RepID=A0A8B9AUZ2_PHODC|nr:uncharacterized protein LOC103712381 isoform X3 [Phoenix dactylifera]XP_038989387.1 uncharacterized protein LOC103712381 isoform X3 [Phoenix dactylifera]